MWPTRGRCSRRRCRTSGCWGRAAVPSGAWARSTPARRTRASGCTGLWGWTSAPTGRSRWRCRSSRRFSPYARGGARGRCASVVRRSMRPMPEPQRIGAVVLAAGASRRMGRSGNKMLLELEREPLARRAARRALAAGLAPVVVGVGHEAERVRAVLEGLDCYGDVTAPPLLFRRALFGELLDWTGEGCGKAVVQRHRDSAVVLDWPADRLADIDTPDDFQRLASGV